MLNISSVPLSASMEITKLANLKKAAGEKVINLSIGDNHFDIPLDLKHSHVNNLNQQSCHYTDGQGLLKLRKNITKYFYSNKYHEDEIIITPGVKQGMFYLLGAMKGKKIAVIEPTWLGYSALCTLTGKLYIPIDINNKNWITELRNTSFDALILCSPNNPNGYVFKDDELSNIKEICTNKGSTIIIDEIYKSFLFEGSHSYIESWYGADNVFIFNGFSKSFAVTGLRIGYCLSKDKAMIENMTKLQQNIATCPNSLAQKSLVEANNVSLKEYVNYYNENRELVSEIIPEFSPFKPDGGFYYFVNLSAIGIDLSAEKFCIDLFNKYNVATVPGKSYGRNHGTWMRISYCIDREELKIGLKLIKQFLDEYEED